MAGKSKKAATGLDNGSGNGASNVAPAPKNGPNLSLRARNLAQIERLKRASGKAGLSLNTWCIEVLDRAAVAAGVTR